MPSAKFEEPYTVAHLLPGGEIDFPKENNRPLELELIPMINMGGVIFSVIVILVPYWEGLTLVD